MFQAEYIYNAPLLSKGKGARDFKSKLSEKRAEGICSFLSEHGLNPDSDADFTVNLLNGEEIAATGSLCGNVLKFIAVSDKEQGTGASATVVSELVNYAYRNGISKLFLFTKPKNEMMFSALGFYVLAKTEHSVMMENTKTGIAAFLDGIKAESPNINGNIGAIVANCNPMTNGHLYLIEQAAKQSDLLHVFILSEDKSKFSAEVRFDIVKNCTTHIKNLCLHKSSEYIVSSATFPSYFLKEGGNKETVNADLDLVLFGEKIAPALRIKTRFVGTEPFCKTTAVYNERMKELLPKYGIAVVEMERTAGISASKIRKLMEEKNFSEIEKLVPKYCFEVIKKC